VVVGYTPERMTTCTVTPRAAILFSILLGLDEASALRLFCEHYKDVVETPDGSSHGNIRAFMGNGWEAGSGVAARITLRKLGVAFQGIGRKDSRSVVATQSGHYLGRGQTLSFTLSFGEIP